MNDATDSETVTNGDDLNINELDMLKTRARILGITFSNNIGVEALRLKVKAKMDGDAEAPGSDVPQPAALAVSQANPLESESGTVEVPTKVMSIREYLRKEQLKLVRLRITNLDPKKKDLPGEIFTVANEYLGTIRKYIPYGEITDDGYHVPYCMYKELEQRKFLHIKTGKDRKGHTQVEQRWVREFALEVLAPLSKDEISKLAAAQAAAGGNAPEEFEAA